MPGQPAGEHPPVREAGLPLWNRFCEDTRSEGWSRLFPGIALLAIGWKAAQLVLSLWN